MMHRAKNNEKKKKLSSMKGKVRKKTGYTKDG